jgi:hypothetical protein
MFYFSTMLYIYAANKLTKWRLRMGQIGERRELLTIYVLMKATRKANLHLRNYGFKSAEVDTKDWPLLIQRCRKETLAYIRYRRKEEKSAKQSAT